jgi:competence protein ComEC
MEFGEAYIKILNPSKPPDRNSSSPYKTSSNDNGMVMKITFGDVAILLPSDITRFAEKRLSVDEKDLKSDILSAPHHGSATSSSSIFIEKVRPKIVVFSCGKKNNFNFPNPGVVEKYEKIGARIFRTDKNGAVAIETDGKNIVTCCFKGN